MANLRVAAGHVLEAVKILFAAAPVLQARGHIDNAERELYELGKLEPAEQPAEAPAAAPVESAPRPTLRAAIVALLAAVTELASRSQASAAAQPHLDAAQRELEVDAETASAPAAGGEPEPAPVPAADVPPVVDPEGAGAPPPAEPVPAEPEPVEPPRRGRR